MRLGWFRRDSRPLKASGKAPEEGREVRVNILPGRIYELRRNLPYHWTCHSPHAIRKERCSTTLPSPSHGHLRHPPYLIHHAPAKSTNQKLAAFQKKPALLPRSAFHPNAVLGSGTAVYLLPGTKDQYNTDGLGQLTSTGFELMTMKLGLGPGEKAGRSSRWNREKGLPSRGVGVVVLCSSGGGERAG